MKCGLMDFARRFVPMTNNAPDALKILLTDLEMMRVSEDDSQIDLVDRAHAEILRLHALLAYGTDTDAYRSLRARNNELQAALKGAEIALARDDDVSGAMKCIQGARDKIINVFTPDEVVALERYQRTGEMHPFTCSNRGDGNHRDTGVDLGALVPTVRGWICPYCDYTQSWAHPFMKTWPATDSGDPEIPEGEFPNCD